MCWVYVLKNEETNRYYIGSTVSLEKRVREHIRGSTRITRILKTFALVYKEEFTDILSARIREKKLKSYKSRKYIEWLINKTEKGV